MGYRCDTCGEEHDELPRDLAFHRPQAYLDVPEDEREERCHATDDLCRIDDQVFLMRGTVWVPIVGSDESFVWGLWAEVPKPKFDRALELWQEDGSVEPAFEGVVSTRISIYPELLGSCVDVQLGPASERPRFVFRDHASGMGAEQRDGITLERVHEILRALCPHVFE